MDSATRAAVWSRAHNRCEYCRTPHAPDDFLPFLVEHIIAQQHLHDDSFSNLALACPDCNLHKGPNLTSSDPVSLEIVKLFNPRLDAWEDHFELRGARIVGISAIGGATVRLLRFNAEERVRVRKVLIATGLFK